MSPEITLVTNQQNDPKNTPDKCTPSVGKTTPTPDTTPTETPAPDTAEGAEKCTPSVGKGANTPTDRGQGGRCTPSVG